MRCVAQPDDSMRASRVTSRHRSPGLVQREQGIALSGEYNSAKGLHGYGICRGIRCLCWTWQAWPGTKHSSPSTPTSLWP
eukprot:2056631-Rhodomonas_salina.2